MENDWTKEIDMLRAKVKRLSEENKSLQERIMALWQTIQWRNSTTQ
jgi:chaperonin cofactor prefoldin